MPKYEIHSTKKYRRHVKRAEARKLPLDELDAVVDMLSDDVAMPARYSDHDLGGDMIGYKECHIRPDWLLVYQKFEQERIILLVDNGSHSDLFKNKG